MGVFEYIAGSIQAAIILKIIFWIVIIIVAINIIASIFAIRDNTAEILETNQKILEKLNNEKDQKTSEKIYKKENEKSKDIWLT